MAATTTLLAETTYVNWVSTHLLVCAVRSAFLCYLAVKIPLHLGISGEKLLAISDAKLLFLFIITPVSSTYKNYICTLHSIKTYNHKTKTFSKLL